MSTTTPVVPADKLPFLVQLRARERLPLMLGVAALVAVFVALLLWARTPDYQVLYSNLSDRDGGAIITALQQMNVPYKFAEHGGAILVPSDQVHEARLRLATQGLPKGGSVGFELMDHQPFGISQFAEQVNYQRALEGELARTVEAISSVQGARVLLAIPKPSVFVRDQQKPTASVMLTLYPGRVLDDGQVNAIVHMVASSVPDMPASNVTVLDQNGNLLSAPASDALGLDANQLKYVRALEQSYQRRIEAILTPLVGQGNVHAQVSADIDFSRVEQTAETYKPNQGDQAILSQQTSESQQVGGQSVGGVPGALSNQPPATPTASPANNLAPAQSQRQANAAGTGQPPGGASAAQAPQGPRSDRKDSTVNYQVDRTIRHTQEASGGVKRISAAVVVNYRPGVNAAGKPALVPLTSAQLQQIQGLVKDAIGFSGTRGDTVNVVNSPFELTKAPVDTQPWWQRSRNIELAKYIGKYALVILVGLYLWFGVLRPALRRLLAAPPAPEPQAVAAAETTTEVRRAGPEAGDYERNLEFARQVARQDPKVMATVVKSWVSGDER
ncbi:flagellar M-ring protein FliF [Pandoraea thiooxydans]|uniref:Flagellar M-ring protein n=1 Tax=Pandoraea thiooxydans TaxID=445709 RepID=A0A0G3ERM1_9BURK|nr:flagellar basal-body MS-ring/collar protein FliF [Pandoraea thiooxydans]AKJ69728.1 flagellar M-ring protein FliF [Pandoraea thiooxydans]